MSTGGKPVQAAADDQVFAEDLAFVECEIDVMADLQDAVARRDAGERDDATLEADRGRMSPEPKDRHMLIHDAGFAVTDLRAGYMRGPRPFTFMYRGRAKRE